ncbi:MAG: SoxR reducing system RseC family protein [Bacteroides sp.]
MEGKSCTYRRAVILSVKGDLARVQFINESACASCHAKSACGAADTKLYEVDARIPQGDSFAVGEEVRVAVHNQQGYFAIFLGYVLPFLLLMLALVVTNLLGASELVMALGMLGMLAVYYFVLYLLRSRVSRRFSFTISSERKLE